MSAVAVKPGKKAVRKGAKRASSVKTQKRAVKKTATSSSHARARKAVMDMPGIRKKAKQLGITPGRMKKVELIHSIQQTEGCTPCFGTSNGQCSQAECCFIADCLKT